jgi:hypothetical protein
VPDLRLISAYFRISAKRLKYPVNGHKQEKFTFENPKGVWLPHHAAVFAPTRWTNLYFPCHAIFWGDLIGGPLVSAFGSAIRDVPVETKRRFGLLSHTLYWTLPKKGRNVVAPWIEELRKAVRICQDVGAANPPSAGGMRQ